MVLIETDFYHYYFEIPTKKPKVHNANLLKKNKSIAKQILVINKQ